MGILFAFVALLAWGVGDFLIQRSARQFGIVDALFAITSIGTITLLPFVMTEIPDVVQSPSALGLLLGVTAVCAFAALFDFEALRIGKISVIEPIYAFEVIITAVLGAMFLREYPTFIQAVCILAVTFGIIFVSLEKRSSTQRLTLEHGVIYAVLATVAMGGVNFLFGAAGRETSPLMVNWFTSAGLSVGLGVYLTVRRRWTLLWQRYAESKRLVLSVGVVDNLAWIAFTYSATMIPVAIATGISESYIALASGLGLYINRERLMRRQVFGLVLSVVAAVVLAFTLR